MRGAHAHIKIAAYHEAGHALAAIREGVRVRFAQIYRRAPGAGSVHLAIARAPRNPFTPSAGIGAAQAAWEILLKYHLRIIRINLAGPLAEARYLGQPLRTLGALSDLTECQQIAGSLAAFHHELAETYGDLPKFRPFERISEERKRVRRWLARPRTWQTITAIAHALIERERLSEQELLQIYLTARSPLIQSVLPLVKSTANKQVNTNSLYLGSWAHQIAQPIQGLPSTPILVPTKLCFTPWKNPESNLPPVRGPRRDSGLSWLIRSIRVIALRLGVRIARPEESV